MGRSCRSDGLQGSTRFICIITLFSLLYFLKVLIPGVHPIRALPLHILLCIFNVLFSQSPQILFPFCFHIWAASLLNFHTNLFFNPSDSIQVPTSLLQLPGQVSNFILLQNLQYYSVPCNNFLSYFISFTVHFSQLFHVFLWLIVLSITPYHP